MDLMNRCMNEWMDSEDHWSDKQRGVALDLEGFWKARDLFGEVLWFGSPNLLYRCHCEALSRNAGENKPNSCPLESADTPPPQQRVPHTHTHTHSTQRDGAAQTHRTQTHRQRQKEQTHEVTRNIQHLVEE